MEKNGELNLDLLILSTNLLRDYKYIKSKVGIYFY